MTTTTTATTATQETKQGTLDKLIDKYTQTAIMCGILTDYDNCMRCQLYVDALDELAQVLAYSVLKTKRMRVNKPHMVESGDGTLTETGTHYYTLIDDVTNGLKQSIRMLAREHNVNETVGYLVQRDKLGYIESYVPKSYSEDGTIDENSETQADAVKASMNECIDDGYEVLQEARLAIIAETKHSIETFGTIDLKKEYTVKEINHRAYARKEDFCKAIKERDTTGVKNMYLSVSRSITDGRATNAQSKPEVLVPFGLTDTETGDDIGEVFLRRKLNTATRAEGAAETLIPDNETDTETVFDIMDRANLSKQQRKIIEMRLQGYGRKAIATAMHVKLGSVNVQLKRIGEKLYNIGITV